MEMKNIVQKQTDNGMRYYDVEGQAYASVTTVLNCKPNYGLQKWRKDLGEDVADFETKRCAKRGSETHELIEAYLTSSIPTMNNLLPIALFNIMKPYIDMISDVKIIEGRMYSDKLRIAGTTDCIGYYNDILSVIDFKTSNKHKEYPNEKYMMQCTAYALMYEEMYGEEINQLVIINGSEDGGVISFVRNKEKYIPKLKEYINFFYNMMENNNE